MNLDDTQKILNSFDNLNKKNPKLNPCVVEVNGQRVKMRSGKSHWNQIRFAKNAIRNHLEHIIYYEFCDGNPSTFWRQRREKIDWLMNNLVGEGADCPIRIVRVD